MRDDSTLLAPAENPDVTFVREKLGEHLPLVSRIVCGKMVVVGDTPRNAILAFYNDAVVMDVTTFVVAFDMWVPLPWSWNEGALTSVAHAIGGAIAQLSNQESINIAIYHSHVRLVSAGRELVLTISDLQITVVAGEQAPPVVPPAA